ncbi:hypothetical protein Hanom_Chr17g01535121 [Helianthus anomalus]
MENAYDEKYNVTYKLKCHLVLVKVSIISINRTIEENFYSHVLHSQHGIKLYYNCCLHRGVFKSETRNTLRTARTA